jgi:spermidine synthase
MRRSFSRLFAALTQQSHQVKSMKRIATRGRIICLLYGISGCAGLMYETAWIRAFTISFGNTLLSFSTVIGVYLAGLAIGSAGAGRTRTRHGLAWYGAAEVFIAIYALAVPWLMETSQRLLIPFYSSGGGATLALARGLLSAAILFPATLAMGASFPWLASSCHSTESSSGVSRIYAVNTAGGAAGALLTGLILIPAFGYRGAVITGSVLDISAGVAALAMARRSMVSPVRSDPVRHSSMPGSVVSLSVLGAVAALSGCGTMLYEVVWNRVAGLLFGPTAATVTFTLAMVLIGLAAGAVLASAVRRDEAIWLAGSQCAVAILLLVFSGAVTASPAWLAEQIRARSADPLQMELLEAGTLLVLLLPVGTAAGVALPLAMRLLGLTSREAVGKLYALNAAGCIGGALITGWLLVPALGMERTLYLGALMSAGAAVVLSRGHSSGRALRASAIAAGTLALAVFLFPRWDLVALTAGAYKYAPYYNQEVMGELHSGELVYLREGKTGTVTVRRIGGSLVLAIDGKVDASDAGGDLLTEKLLAQLPLRLAVRSRRVCVIGLASGVTAGAVLRYPIEQLDVLEISPEVVQASHWFDSVNGRPLDDPRTHLIVNDGRNHLTLTRQSYDAILSEPSNPWIAGMNSLFTREFFQLAKSRLNPGGVLAQWFHLYNMPGDDLRSLLRAFTDVFPSATLWQLNDGDVLLTGGASETTSDPAPELIKADVDPALLSTLYLMRGSDLSRFAATAEPNTDDRPVLELHGLQNLNSQTDARNIQEIYGFRKQLTPPSFILAGWRNMSPRLWAERGSVPLPEHWKAARKRP